MDHKLIMENWRRFVDESEDMDPELVEEGLKELAASLVIGLGLATASPAQAGGSINYPFPHSAARSVPAQGQGQAVGLQDVKRYITSMYNEATSAPSQPQLLRADSSSWSISLGENGAVPVLEEQADPFAGEGTAKPALMRAASADWPKSLGMMHGVPNLVKDEVQSVFVVTGSGADDSTS